jgi:catechol 2,3-dioxygenase-like lactoylglutathione lyase family enzyme
MPEMARAYAASKALRCARFPAHSTAMKFEHLALNVPDVRAMTRWYVENLGLTVVRSLDVAPFTQFLADDTGRVFIELYSNPAAVYPDYFATPPLVLHVAFFAPDAGAAQQRLLAAGAKAFSDDTMPDGSRLIFVRDPWGVTIQLCQRAKPFPGF